MVGVGQYGEDCLPNPSFRGVSTLTHLKSSFGWRCGRARTATELLIVQSEFLDALQALTNDHEKTYRLGVWLALRARANEPRP
jgi:hypothetical protein